MYENQKTASYQGETPASDLQSLLFNLSSETSRFREYSSVLYSLVANLKSFPPQKGEDNMAKDANPSGHVDVLRRQIFLFSECNNELANIVNHLQTIAA